MSLDTKLKQAIEIMTRVAEDTLVPRNIRRAVNEAKERLLKSGDDPAVKAAFAVMILDEISDDPNMPVHARTAIWNAVSILETIRG